jgi:hypothetical protein
MKRHLPNLKTAFCFKCKKFMEYPYQSEVDKELYHKFCLPENEDEELKKENEDANN